MKIFGVEILNEGSGVSIDDAVTEMQAAFLARYVERYASRMSKIIRVLPMRYKFTFEGDLFSF